MNIPKIIGIASDIAKHFDKDQEKQGTEVIVIKQPPSPETRNVIDILRTVPGMMAAHSKDFKLAVPYCRLKDGSLVKIYENQFNVLHIFLADKTGEKFIYGGYTLLAKTKLESVLQDIRQKYGEDENNGGW